MLAIPLVLLLATLVHGAPVAVSDRRCVGGADACSRSINCYATGLCGPAFAKKSSLAIPHLKYARQDDDFDFGDSEGDDDSSVDSGDFDSGETEDTSDSFGDNSDSTDDGSSEDNFDSGDSSLDGSSDDNFDSGDTSLEDNDLGEGSDDDGTEEDGSLEGGDVDIDPSVDGGLGDEGSAPVTDTDGDQPPIDDDGTETIDDGTDSLDDGTGTIDDGTGTIDDGTGDDGTDTVDDGTGTIDDGTDTVDDGTETTTDPDATSTAADASITDPASTDSDDEDSSTSSGVDADSTSSAAEAASTDDSEASSPSAASTSAAPAAAQTTAAAAQTTAAAAAPTSAADSLTCGGPSPNDATISLIKQFEGFVPSPAPDPIGLATVGFGHKCTSKSCAIAGFTFPLSQTTASQLLNNDLQQFVSCVNSAVSNSVTLTDNQLGALTSFAFNLGCGTLKSSTLLKRLNAGEDPNTVAAAEIPRFNKAGRSSDENNWFRWFQILYIMVPSVA